MHREKVAKNSDATRDVREEKKGKVQRADRQSQQDQNTLISASGHGPAETNHLT